MPTRTLDVKVEFQWDGVNWTDETANLINAKGALETIAPNEAYQSGRMIIQQVTLTLANPDLRYSSYNSQSPLYPYLNANKSYLCKCRIRVSVNGGPYEPIFVGYVKRPKENFARNQMAFTLWDAGEVMKQKFSTAILENKFEHEVVQEWLGKVGELAQGVDWTPSSQDQLGSVMWSTVRIPYTWLDDEDIWSELQDLAQASGARIYVGRDGKVRYEKGYAWVLPIDYTPEVIELGDMSDMEPVYDDKAFFDEVVVEYSPRSPGSHEQDLWELTRPKLIYQDREEEIVARLRQPAYRVDPIAENENYFITKIDGTDVTETVKPTAVYYAQQVELKIHNTGVGEPIVYAQAKLSGQPLVGQPSEQVKKKTNDPPKFGKRLELRGNPYLMSELQAQTVRDFLVWWYTKIKMAWGVKGLPGVPTREIGRRVVVRIPIAEDNTFEIRCVILKVDWQIAVTESSAFRYSQDLLLLEDVFLDRDYFILGQSTFAQAHSLWI